MRDENTSPTLSEKGYTIIPVSKEPYPYFPEEDTGSAVVMDITILGKNGVKTLRPISKPYRNSPTASDTSHENKDTAAGSSNESFSNSFSPLRWLVETYKTMKSHIKIKEIVYITIAAMLVGILAVMIDANSRNTSLNTMVIDRLDRLIRAVEMDWGR